MGFFDLFSKDSSSDNNQKSKYNLSINKDSKGIVESLLIPEPTRSLLWTTDEDTSKIEHAGSINMVITISEDAVNITEKKNGYFAEPSLIWTKLPIRPNNDLSQDAMYWPSYSSFSPETRFQYLHWLRDITQPTNLSYVFLYFYGLERHLLVGEYDAAVDEIARLLKAHPKESFIRYASQSLIVASLGKNRLDIMERVPSLMEEEIDEALALRIIKGTSMSPDDVISISSKIGFKNKRYIKQYPEEFKADLQKHIDEFEKQFGNLLSTFKLENLKQKETMVFANLSIPESFRHIRVPAVLEDERFKTGMNNLLQAAHDSVKAKIANGYIERITQPQSAPKQQKLIDTKPVTDEEVNVLIDSLRADNDDVLDLHFAILGSITEHYRQRQEGDNYHKAIVACKAQIRIQADAAKQFILEYPKQPLPFHTGYNQLVIVLEKQKRYKEALDLAKEAKVNGWGGDWDKRIEKLRGKL